MMTYTDDHQWKTIFDGRLPLIKTSPKYIGMEEKERQIKLLN